MICLCCQKNDEAVINTEEEHKRSNGDDDDDNSTASVYYDAIASLDDRQSMLRSSIFHSAHNHRHSTTHEERRGSTRKSILQSIIFRAKLQETRMNYPDTDYPGHLTDEQLQTCLEFRKRINNDESDQGVDNPTRRAIVYAFREIENEAYAICRYLRARNYDIEATLEMIDGYIPRWKEGQEHSFYPNFEAVCNDGGDESALLSQFPLVMGGLAKNGCMILYFTVKQLNLDGIECIMNLDRIGPYMWYFVLQKYILEVKKRQVGSSIRPVQVMVVVDLDRLQILTLRRTMGVLQTALGILGVFPEFLFNVIICNVPRFFHLFWRIIKTFLDPSTANKFELYSKKYNGQERLLELVDPSQLAEDFGGTALSTNDLEQVDGYSRQIVHMIQCLPGKTGEGTFSLADREQASINLYTNCTADATLSIDNAQYRLGRTGNEPNEVPYFRDKVASLRGKGKYQAKIEMSGSSSPDFFLIVALVTENT